MTEGETVEPTTDDVVDRVLASAAAHSSGYTPVHVRRGAGAADDRSTDAGDAKQRRRPVRPRRPRGAAPRGRPLHRARRRHRGRVPPAAPRERRAHRRLLAGQRSRMPRTRCASSPPSPRPPAPSCSTACCSAAPHPDPSTYLGKGKAQELRGCRRGARRRHRHRRHRARPEPAACARGRRQGEGHRPHRRHPRHLQPARQEPRGQGAGRARPARVPASAPARLG